MSSGRANPRGRNGRVPHWATESTTKTHLPSLSRHKTGNGTSAYKNGAGGSSKGSSSNNSPTIMGSGGSKGGKSGGVQNGVDGKKGSHHLNNNNNQQSGKNGSKGHHNGIAMEIDTTPTSGGVGSKGRKRKMDTPPPLVEQPKSKRLSTVGTGNNNGNSANSSSSSLSVGSSPVMATPTPASVMEAVKKQVNVEYKRLVTQKRQRRSFDGKQAWNRNWKDMNSKIFTPYY